MPQHQATSFNPYSPDKAFHGLQNIDEGDEFPDFGPIHNEEDESKIEEDLIKLQHAHGDINQTSQNEA